MNVALIGGTGFVGTYLTEALLAAGHRPRLLVRAPDTALPAGCEQVQGRVDSPSALRDCLRGCDAVIYLIGILREFPERGITFEALQYQGVVDTIAAAQDEGVPRFLLMSANGVEAQGTPYQQTKYRAEMALKASGLRWTIFQPSVIFGDPRGRMEFCSQLKRELIDPPLPAPLFYRGLNPRDAGGFKLAPVAVTDVAAAFVKALERPECESQTYSLCGPARMTWKQILTTIAASVGKQKLMLPAPAAPIHLAARLMQRFAWFPLTADQLAMLLEGNVCARNDSFARLEIAPVHFGVDALQYLTTASNRP